MTDSRRQDTHAPKTDAWVTPRLEPRGELGAVLLGGGGKLSIRGGDPGEMRCQRGGTRCNRD